MISYLKNIDIKMLNMINKKFHYRILDKIMPLVTALGNGGIVWFAISIYLIGSENNRTEGYMVLASIVIAAIIGEGIIKHLIKRTRPFVNMLECKLLISKPITYSFPSGHTASSFAAAGIFAAYGSKYSILMLILASLIAFSRIYLSVHYPTDVLMGIILGLICSRIAILLFHSKIISYLGLYNY